MRCVVATVCLLVGTACGTKHLPAPPRPDANLPGQPEVRAPQPPNRVLIHTDQPARVLQSPDARELCATTPCVVQLPSGEHELELVSREDEERRSTASVSSSREPSVVRHTLGRQAERSWATPAGVILAILGVGAIVGGGVMFDIEQKAGSGTAFAPALFLTGIAFSFGGGTLIWLDRPSVQPGATTQWITTAPKTSEDSAP